MENKVENSNNMSFLEDLKQKGIEIIVDKSIPMIKNMDDLKKFLSDKEMRKKIKKITIINLHKFYEAFAEFIKNDSFFEGLLANKISNTLFTNNISKSQLIKDFEYKYGVRICSFDDKSNIVGLTEEKLLEYVKDKKIKLMVANVKALEDNKKELPELEETFNEMINERNQLLGIKVSVQKPKTNQIANNSKNTKQQSGQTQKKSKVTSKNHTNTPTSSSNNNLIEINSLNGRGIKGYKETVDKFLKATYMKYGKDATILVFEQYYKENGNISKVKIDNKEKEFKGEDRALKVLNAKYVEYVLNFEKNKDKNFYDLSPKERRLFEGINTLYLKLKDKGIQTEKIPEQIVEMITEYIRIPEKLEKDESISEFEALNIPGVSRKDIINIMVSSELDRIIEKEKRDAENEKREPEFRKSPLEEKYEEFKNNSDNIQISAIRYMNSVREYDKSKSKSTVRANLQASKIQLLEYMINNSDSINIIPNLDIKKIRLVLESFNKSNETKFNYVVKKINNERSILEELNYESETLIEKREQQNEDGTIKIEKYEPNVESLENLNSYLTSINSIEKVTIDANLPYAEKQNAAEEYMKNAVDMYIILKRLAEQARNTITERKVLAQSTEQYESLLENILEIYSKMMDNGNDRLISQYIAIDESQKEIEHGKGKSKATTKEI